MATTPEKLPTRAQPAEQHEWLGGGQPPQPESGAPYPNGGNGAYDEPPGLATLDARAPIGSRTKPNNIDAEQAVLGAVLVNNEAYARVAGFLRSTDFYEPVHGRIYAAISRLIDAGRVADHVTMAEQFDQDEALRGLDGHKYLASLAHGAETILNAEDYGHLLHDLAIRRSVIALGEAAANKAYDPTAPESAGDQVEQMREQINSLTAETHHRKAHPCVLPSLDWARIANEEPPPERWLIDDWIPMGTSGITTGPGAAGKSYLELIRLICLAAGLPFLGHYAVEPAPCLGYFSEDTHERLWARARKICSALHIDPSILIDRLDIVSTVGSHRHLITSDAHAPTTTVTDWMNQVHDRAREKSVRYIAFDHVGRYLAINRNDPNQVFSAFSHLDALATSIDGSIGLLAHPSKTDIRNKAKGGGSPIVAYVGGSAAMIDAPRWVHVLDTVTFPEGKCRVLTNEKPNYSRRFAAKIPENVAGIVEFEEEVDPDQPAGENSISSRGRKSSADRTLMAMEELYRTFRRAVHVDELIPDCIKRGIFGETQQGTAAWRNLRRTVRKHLECFPRQVEMRDNDTFAMLPGA